LIQSFSTLKEYFVRDRWFIAAGFLSLIIVDFLQLIIPRFIKNAVDALTAGTATAESLTAAALYIAATGLLIALFRFGWRYCLIGTSRRIERSLRDRLFSHIIRLPLENLIKTKTGDLMARMTNDLDAVRMCSGIGIVALVDTFILGSAAVVFMLYISPVLTLMSLAPLFFIIFFTRRMSRLLHQRFGQVQASFSQLTEKVRETFSGISVIKAFVREEASSVQFSAMSRDYIDKNLRLVRIWGLLFPLIVVFSNISICILLYFGGRMTIAGNITTGDFVAFASYIWILTWPMMALGWVVNIFQRGSASMIRINDILSRVQESTGSGLSEASPGIAGRSFAVLIGGRYSDSRLPHQCWRMFRMPACRIAGRSGTKARYLLSRRQTCCDSCCS